jgi:hypothetical protein
MKESYDVIFETYEKEIENIKKIFYEKSVNYGKDNIKDENTDTLEALDALFFRMRDKINRFKKMNASQTENEESIVDTLRDLANYALIASVVAQEKWI